MSRSLTALSLPLAILLLMGCQDAPGSTPISMDDIGVDGEVGVVADVSSNADPDAGPVQAFDAEDWAAPDVTPVPLPQGSVTIGPDDRPATLLIPDSYDGVTAMPVVFLFHGYTATSSLQDAYFGLSQRIDERDFLLVLPDGLTDAAGQQYWNATDFCCDNYGAEPDDVGYFVVLLNEVLDDYSGDPDRVHLMGHSNGNFFANRLACEMGSRITSVVGLAGGTHWSSEDCPTDGTVSMLHIHGTLDAVIAYTGLWGSYPGAQTLAQRWAERGGCSDDSEIVDYLNIDGLVLGNETAQRRFAGCPDGIDVELWSIVGGSHLPNLRPDFADRILDFALPRTNPDATP